MEEKAEKKDFIRFVNRIYYINSHLIERLDELKSSALFTDVQKNISATIVLLELQVNQINSLFNTLKAVNSLADCAPMIAFMESIFTIVQSQDNKTPYLSLLDYLSVADSLTEESARLAKFSLTSLAKLNLSPHHLYNGLTLQSLRAALEDFYIVT